MTTLFTILVVLASLILSLIVLVQNPKGGGLAGNIAGFSNQFMGVKQTTDVLEKGTWLFAGVIGLLSLFSVIFLSKVASGSPGADQTQESTGPVPANSQPANNTAPFTTPPSGGQPTTPNK